MIFDGENGNVTFFKKREIFSSTLVVNYLLYILVVLSLIGFYLTMKIHSNINTKIKNRELSTNSEKIKLIK